MAIHKAVTEPSGGANLRQAIVRVAMASQPRTLVTQRHVDEVTWA